MSTRRDTRSAALAFVSRRSSTIERSPAPARAQGGLHVSAPAPSFDAPLLLGAQIEARAAHPDVADRVFLRQHDRAWTFRRYRDECVRVAHFLRRRLGPIDDGRPGHVAMLLENHLELLALYGACGYAGLTLFGVNTGLRGETLAGVIDQSGARLLVVDQRLWPEVERVRAALAHVRPENILVVRTSGEAFDATDLETAVGSEVGFPEVSLDAPAVDMNPAVFLIVICTSGTTGCPRASTTIPSSCSPSAWSCRATWASTWTTSATPTCRCSTRTPSSWASSPRCTCAAASHCVSASARRASCPTSSATASRTGTTSASRSTTCSPPSRRSTAATWTGSMPGSPGTRGIGCATPWATAPPRRTSSASWTGSVSRTCSSSTARQRLPSARSGRRAIRAARSARSRIRR